MASTITELEFVLCGCAGPGYTPYLSLRLYFTENTRILLSRRECSYDPRETCEPKREGKRG